MPIIEDNVKEAMKIWLTSQGYLDVKVKLSTRQGYDVEGKHPVSGKCLVVECKGESPSGKNEHAYSWGKVATAILTVLSEIGNPDKDNDVGLAFPDTKEYKERMQFLQDFCKQQKITVYWISQNGKVTTW